MDKTTKLSNFLFNCEIGRHKESNFLSATDLIRSVNLQRIDDNICYFNLSVFMKSERFKKLKSELELHCGVVVAIKRGKNGCTWVHPILFNEIALALDPTLKGAVYEWMDANSIDYKKSIHPKNLPV